LALAQEHVLIQVEQLAFSLSQESHKLVMTTQLKQVSMVRAAHQIRLNEIAQQNNALSTAL
jgi:hypothetical protein